MLIPDSTRPVVYNYDEPEEVQLWLDETDRDEFCRKKVEDTYESGGNRTDRFRMIDSEEGNDGRCRQQWC